MGFRKGQAALDFLMTYGWAIALVVIIAAVLFSLGVFDVSNFLGSKASGFSGVSVKGWQLASGANSTLTIMLSNQVGQAITVNSVNVTINTATGTYTTPIPLASGADSTQFTVSGLGYVASGASYTAQVKIGYSDANSFNYVTAGTLVGKAT